MGPHFIVSFLTVACCRSYVSPSISRLIIVCLHTHHCTRVEHITIMTLFSCYLDSPLNTSCGAGLGWRPLMQIASLCSLKVCSLNHGATLLRDRSIYSTHHTNTAASSPADAVDMQLDVQPTSVIALFALYPQPTTTTPNPFHQRSTSPPNQAPMSTCNLNATSCP